MAWAGRREEPLKVEVVAEEVVEVENTGGKAGMREAAGKMRDKKPQTHILTLYDVPLDDGFQMWLAALCEKRGLDYAVMVAMAEQESGFDPCAVGAMGELGMWQVMPGTAAEAEEALGRRLNLFDPYDNAECASWLMEKYMGKYGNDVYALFAYSMGEAGAEECLKAGVPRSLYAALVLEKAAGYVPRRRLEAGDDG